MLEKSEDSPQLAKHDWFDSVKVPGKNYFYCNGLYFSCIRCSSCCRHESGYVYLSKNDVSRLISHLKIESKAFIKSFCRWIPSMNEIEQLSLKEKRNLDCIFWAGSSENFDGGCSVYEARPLQCRSFPFWQSVLYDKNSWKATARECPGMDKGFLHTKDSIEKWLDMRQKEPIIFRSGVKKGIN